MSNTVYNKQLKPFEKRIERCVLILKLLKTPLRWSRLVKKVYLSSDIQGQPVIYYILSFLTKYDFIQKVQILKTKEMKSEHFGYKPTPKGELFIKIFEKEETSK